MDIIISRQESGSLETLRNLLKPQGEGVKGLGLYWVQMRCKGPPFWFTEWAPQRGKKQGIENCRVPGQAWKSEEDLVWWLYLAQLTSETQSIEYENSFIFKRQVKDAGNLCLAQVQREMTDNRLAASNTNNVTTAYDTGYLVFFLNNGCRLLRNQVSLVACCGRNQKTVTSAEDKW